MAFIQRRGGPQLESLLRRFGITVGAAGQQVTEGVVAVAPVPRLDVLCGGSKRLAALASNRSMVQLFNPVGSGVIATLHRIYVSVTTPAAVFLRKHNAALADAVTFIDVLNRELVIEPEPSCLMKSLRGTAVGATTLEFDLDTADRMEEIDLTRLGETQKYAGASLAEGLGFVIVTTTDNVGLLVNYIWSERIQE